MTNFSNIPIWTAPLSGCAELTEPYYGHAWKNRPSDTEPPLWREDCYGRLEALRRDADTNPDSQYLLGIYYYTLAIQGQSEYVLEAVRWFERARIPRILPDQAALMEFEDNFGVWGMLGALEGLAYCYQYGIGVPQDLIRACQLRLHLLDYNPSLPFGIEEEKEEVVSEYPRTCVSAVRISDDNARALLWYQKTADISSISRAALAVAYANGVGVTQDHQEALKWYRTLEKTELQGWARYQLWHCYREGWGVERDLLRAMHYLLTCEEGSEESWVEDTRLAIGDVVDDPKSWKPGETAAERCLRAWGLDRTYFFPAPLRDCCAIAQCYQYGHGVPQDARKAFEIYHAHKAWFRVGECYALGSGVPQDVQKAIAYFSKSRSIAATLYLKIYLEEGIWTPDEAQRAVIIKYFKDYYDFWFDRAASAMWMASLYIHGGGIPLNFEKALKWNATGTSVVCNKRSNAQWRQRLQLLKKDPSLISRPFVESFFM